LPLLCQGHCWIDLPLSKGGRQGGVETPGLWTRVLDLSITAAKKRWRNEGLGAAFPCSLNSSYTFICLVWADDIIIVSESIKHARQMFTILEDEIAKHRPDMETFVARNLESRREMERDLSSMGWCGGYSQNQTRELHGDLGREGGPKRFG